jgi:uncharacterized protein YcbK (DUF882 family)
MMWRWPNFRIEEFLCPLSGEMYMHEPSLDALQKFRDLLGQPVYVNSGHRSPVYNAMVGGAPLSMHKKLAFDVSLRNHTGRRSLLGIARTAGFRGIGLYKSFIHLDCRENPAFWYGSGAEKLWNL